MLIGTPRRKQQHTNPNHSKTTPANNTNGLTNSDGQNDTTPAATKHITTTNPSTDDRPNSESNDDTKSNPTQDNDNNIDDDKHEQHNNDDNDLEPWSDWIQRATHEAEERINKVGIEDWIVQLRRRKWRWAQRVANWDNTR